MFEAGGMVLIVSAQLLHCICGRGLGLCLPGASARFISMPDSAEGRYMSPRRLILRDGHAHRTASIGGVTQPAKRNNNTLG